MTLNISQINPNYFAGRKYEECRICKAEYDQDGESIWVAHEDPDARLRTVTRSFFSYRHPMHKDCFESWQASRVTQQLPVTCPECRQHIGSQDHVQNRDADFDFEDHAALENAPDPMEQRFFLPPQLPMDGALAIFTSSLIAGGNPLASISLAGLGYLAGKAVEDLTDQDASRFVSILAIAGSALGATSFSLSPSLLATASFSSLLGWEIIQSPMEALFFQRDDNPLISIMSIAFCFGINKLMMTHAVISPGMGMILHAAMGSMISSSIIKAKSLIPQD